MTVKIPTALDPELFATALDTLPFKYYIVDKDLNVLFWNRKGEEGPYGVRQEDAVGKHLEAVLAINRAHVSSPKPIPEMEAEFREVFEKGSIISSEESSVLKSGEKRYYRITKTPLRGEDGDVAHTAVIIEDITDQRRLESMLIAKEKLFALEDLASGIAHQINNPLSTMMLCSESMLNEVRKGAVCDPEAALRFEHYLEMTCKQISRCKQVSNMLVDFGSNEAGKKGRTDVNKLLGEAVSLLKSSKRFSVPSVEKELSADIRTITASEPHLRQVFLSILVNAFEAVDGKAGGAIRVSTFMSGEGQKKEVAVAVQDNGSGMEREKLRRIFTPFFTAKGGSHAGLGLSVAHQIVSGHGGRIEVESEAGKGSTFTVLLPS
ncbi:two-component system, NtrC family, sensor histidine kinase HydH [uncultured bacterium]|nr:two-component system, NtrC family, sensor histidine kinase HydH [uncultured bacterium]